MKIIPLSKWTGKQRKCPQDRNLKKRGTYDPVTKSDQYVVLFPNDTMISVYDKKSFEKAVEYADNYESIRQLALERQQSGEINVYHTHYVSEGRLGREPSKVKKFGRRKKPV